MFGDALDQLRPHLETLLVLTGIVVLGFLGDLIRVARRRGRAWAESLSTDRRWHAAVQKLDAAAEAAMLAAEQTIARGLRDSGGKLTADGARAVAVSAFADAREQLGPAVWDEIRRALDLTPESVEAMLRARIEAAVARTKLGAAFQEIGRLGVVVETPTPTTPAGSDA
jgi:hypothetical protein